jgi:hypothetical protein
MPKKAVTKKTKKIHKNKYLGLKIGWVYATALLFFSFGLMMAYQNCSQWNAGMPLP